MLFSDIDDKHNLYDIVNSTRYKECFELDTAILASEIEYENKQFLYPYELKELTDFGAQVDEDGRVFLPIRTRFTLVVLKDELRMKRNDIELHLFYPDEYDEDERMVDLQLTKIGQLVYKVLDESTLDISSIDEAYDYVMFAAKLFNINI